MHGPGERPARPAVAVGGRARRPRPHRRPPRAPPQGVLLDRLASHEITFDLHAALFFVALLGSVLTVQQACELALAAWPFTPSLVAVHGVLSARREARGGGGGSGGGHGDDGRGGGGGHGDEGGGGGGGHGGGGGGGHGGDGCGGRGRGRSSSGGGARPGGGGGRAAGSAGGV